MTRFKITSLRNGAYKIHNTNCIDNMREYTQELNEDDSVDWFHVLDANRIVPAYFGRT